MEIIIYVSSAVIAVFAIASFVLAFCTYRLNSSTHKLHKSLTIPKLIIYSELIDEDGREPAYTVTIRNVGQYPALNVHVEMNLEEWREGNRVSVFMGQIRWIQRFNRSASATGKKGL